MPKLDPDLRRYVVRALCSYRRDVERLAVLDEYIAAAIGPDRNAGIRDGAGLARQEAIIERKQSSAEWRRLSYRVEVLDRFFGALANSDMVLVETRYFQGMSWEKVGEALGLTPVACRTRRAPRIIRACAVMMFGDLC